MTNPNDYQQPNPNFQINNTDGDQTQILKILQRDTFQISPILLRSLQLNPFIRNDYNFQNKEQQIDTLKRNLISYDKAVQLTLQIGWTDHTGDWDPFYKIILTDGTEIFTESGYSNIERITDTEITFNNSNEDTGDEEFLTLQLDQIQQLQILES